jgi:hypothetical protein
MEAVRQANLQAFVDVFFLGAILMLAIVPFVLFLRRPKHATAMAAAH